MRKRIPFPVLAATAIAAVVAACANDAPNPVASAPRVAPPSAARMNYTSTPALNATIAGPNRVWYNHTDYYTLSTYYIRISGGTGEQFYYYLFEQSCRLNLGCDPDYGLVAEGVGGRDIPVTVWWDNDMWGKRMYALVREYSGQVAYGVGDSAVKYSSGPARTIAENETYPYLCNQQSYQAYPFEEYNKWTGQPTGRYFGFGACDGNPIFRPW